MSLTSLGLIVVPMLFANLPSPALAGNMAAKLFSAQTWVSVACAMGLLLLLRRSSTTGSELGREIGSESGTPFALVSATVLWVLAGLLLALLVEFGVSPRIVARENLRLWHSVGSLMYLLQWVSALGVFWRLTPTTKPPTV